ncbi:fasciclin domain-containing protein [Pseudozobellia thermophila]|uniref:Uncaracterized surface protein containing fasciclin (FAS1) repeats n=1 Tax=Pseudozobellia thermophila TaxID=192903 RepID=A0A1M6MLN8_9FLAO|nr:fasciclin domain-containing protein [Pseudozobellia thermophila]SHJ84193.1 Uncaracterized surface protein containing fasciclin (FAS1) repeats [Pseudozobellia thermophila]
MKLNKMKLLVPFAFLLFFAVSCSDDDNGIVMEEEMEEMEEEEMEEEEEQSSIVELALATADLSILVDALTEAELVETLQGDGPFTVFAPTNAAFEAFLSDNGFASLDDIPEDVLEQVLLNHVVAGNVMSTDLSTTYISSLSTAGVDDRNISLYVDISNGVTINGSAVTTADIEASNGVVHVVDQVIGLPNIVDHAVYNPALSELVGALTMDGNTTFTDLLADPETMFTVLAPVNDAFTAFDNPNGNDLDAILSNHVIAGASLAAADLSNGYANTAATNGDGDNLSIYINVDDGVQFNGQSSVAISDVVATNGIIHAVDAVIDLPTVVTFAVADSENFSSLVGALTSEGQPDFVSVLSSTTDNAPFTVFAPINSAFASLEEVPEGEALTAVLNHHVIAEANIVSGDLSDGLVSPATLEGDTLTFNEADGTFTITDGAGNMGTGIVKADVQAINGVIHAVDQVLIPSTED